MFKKISIGLYCALILAVIPVVFYVMNTSSINSQVMAVSINSSVVYELPYTGILPDHPLYIFKAIRDRLLDWSTRDNQKKAELFLLLSDKRISMSIQLQKKGKNKLAIDTLSKAEKYALKIPDLLSQAKKQGQGLNETLVYKANLSSDKHREIINTLSRELPQGEEQEINLILEINSKAKKGLQAL